MERESFLVWTLPYLLATNPPGADALSQAFTLGDTYLFGNNVVNAFRIAGNRQSAQRVAAKYVSMSEVGVNVYDGYQPRFSRLTVTGGGSFSVGSPGSADGFNNWATFALNDDVSLVRGNHQLAFGGSAARCRARPTLTRVRSTAMASTRRTPGK
jgi:hypothetical protein